MGTKNNINYKERYHATAVNGLTVFNHIARMLLPDSSGAIVKASAAGKSETIKVSFTNDDKEINYKDAL